MIPGSPKTDPLASNVHVRIRRRAGALASVDVLSRRRRSQPAVDLGNAMVFFESCKWHLSGCVWGCMRCICAFSNPPHATIRSSLRWFAVSARGERRRQVHICG